MGYICKYFDVNPYQASLQLYRDKQTLLYFLGYLKERGVGRDHVSGAGRKRGGGKGRGEGGRGGGRMGRGWRDVPRCPAVTITGTTPLTPHR